jgi:hypothetical protein
MWLLTLAVAATAGVATPASFRSLGPGVEYGTFVIDAKPARGDGLLHVVRVDPQRATLDLACASEAGGGARTAAEWSKERGFVAAINAGMYMDDHRTNVGYLRRRTHLNNPRWNPKYQSVLAFDPVEKTLLPAVIIDRDAPGAKERIEKYRSVVQNLRLVKGDGVNVWVPNGRRWTESLVAMDRRGRILFAFTRTPLEMSDLVGRLVALPLEVTHAMHVEGGPEASLSVHGEGVGLDLAGSYESGFWESDDNRAQWPLPNVLGVRAGK